MEKHTLKEKVGQDQAVSTNLNQDKAEDDSSSPKSPSRRTFLGGLTAMATALSLVLGLAVPAAFSQQPQAPPGTDVYGVNADAQFAEPPPLEFSLEAMGDDPRARILRWNEIAMACTALDHTPPLPGDPRVFREQFGPHRESRALAIVQIAVFDAVNAVTGNRFRSYTGLPAVQHPTGLNVAIAQAAHDTLWRSGLRRAQTPTACSRKTSPSSPTVT